MDFDFDFVIKSIPRYVDAGKLTLQLSFWSILFSLVIGFLCSIIVYYKVPVLRRIISAYIELSRNTPLLIQLFFLYYGITKLGVKLEAFTCAIIGLSFLGGSYMAESFRAGMEAVSSTQIEAGKSIGLNKLQLIRYVIMPQAFAVSIPSLSANAIFLLKETSIVTAIALPDLMFLAKDIIGMYYKTNEALTMLVISYLIILLPISLLLTFIERRVRHAGFGD